MALHAFREVTVEGFVHATESEERVRGAIEALAPGAKVARAALGGHFGQALVRLTASSKEGAVVEAAVAALRGAAGPAIAAAAGRRLSDDLVLHLRVDKQRALRGEVALLDQGPGDVLVVRLKVRAPRLTPEAAVAIVQQAFGNPRSDEEE